MNQLQSISVEVKIIDISLDQLIRLAQYAPIEKMYKLNRLSLNDSDLNLRQQSSYYLRKRKAKITPAKSEKGITKQELENIPKDTVAKPAKRIQNVKIQTKPSSKKAQQNDKSNKQDEKTIKKELFAKNSSRKKIEIVQKPQQSSQKLEKVDQLNLCCFVPYEKQYLDRYHSQYNVKSSQKFDLSQFMHKKHLEQAQENRTATPRKPKQQKCGETHSKYNQSKAEINISHSQSHQQQDHILHNHQDNPTNINQNQDIVQTKPNAFSQLIGPDNNRSQSKSKSKSKAKNPKQTSFSKVVKLNNALPQTYRRIQLSDANQIVKNYSVVSNKTPEKKAIKQTSIFHRKINVKCQDIVPVQIGPLQNQLLLPQQYQKSLDYQRQQEKQKDNEKDQNFLDFYSININPITKFSKKSPQISMVVIEEQLKSQCSKQKVDLNPQIQINHQQIKQKQQKVNRKPERRKIFQSTPTKPDLNKQMFGIDNLSEQEMRMVLGAKGNKYKQAIVLEYIKQSRKNKGK